MTIWNIKAKLARIHKSMTMWFNGLIAMLVINLPFVQATFPQLQAYLPQHIYQYGMLIILVGNMLLRFKTTKPLEMR